MPKTPSRFRPNVVTPGELKPVGQLDSEQVSAHRANRIIELEIAAETNRMNIIISETELNCGATLTAQERINIKQQLKSARSALMRCEASIAALHAYVADADAAAANASTTPEVEATA